MALILSIETSTNVCSVALHANGILVSHQVHQVEKSHSSLLPGIALEICQEKNKSLQDLNAIAISEGPGSYTGLRIGFSTVKGLAYTLEVPAISVPTMDIMLEALRGKCKGEHYLCAMMDARRMEVYVALFNENNQLIRPPQSEIIMEDTFATYLQQGHQIILSGNGAEKCKSVLNSPKIQYNSVKTSSTHLVPLAKEAFINKIFADLAYYEPFYLKPPNITTPKKNILL